MKRFFKMLNNKIFLLIAFAFIFIAPISFSMFINGENVAINFDTFAEFNSDNYVIRNVNKSKSYYTVEKALQMADANDVLYIIPGKTPIITKDCALKNGVKLYLPDNSTDLYNFDLNNTAFHVHEQINAIPKYRSYNAVCSLTIGDNVSFTINSGASLIVAGRITAGNGGWVNNSATYSVFSKVVLNQNSTIYNYGTIESGGYIIPYTYDKGLSNNVDTSNAKLINYSSSKVNVPFTVTEHRGGSRLSVMGSNMQCAPFSTFYLENIAVDTTFEYNSSLAGTADLYASSDYNTTKINLIGNDSSYLIQYSSSNSYVRMNKYFIDITKERNCITDLTLGGNFKLNTLSMDISGVTVSTSNVFFPITYLYNIYLKSGKNSNTGSLNTGSQNFKLYPGSSLTIDEGFSLTANGLAGYDETYADPGNGDLGSSYIYPACSDDGTNKYVGNTLYLKSSFIYNYGSISVNNLSGYIINEKNSGATLNISSSSSTSTAELVNFSTILSGKVVTGVNYTSVTFTAKGKMITSDNIVSSSYSQFEAGKLYLSAADSSGNIGWTLGTSYNSFKVNLNVNTTDSEASVSPSQLTYYSKDSTYQVGVISASASRPYYTFVGWYKDAACSEGNLVREENPISFTEPNTEITIYAKWIANNYTLKYKFFSDDEVEITDSKVANNPANRTTSFTAEETPITLYDPTVNISGYKFSGTWWVDSNFDNEPDKQIPNNTITKSMLLLNEITVYGKIEKDLPDIIYTYISYTHESYTSWKQNTKTETIKTNASRSLLITEAVTDGHNPIVDAANKSFYNYVFKQFNVTYSINRIDTTESITYSNGSFSNGTRTIDGVIKLSDLNAGDSIKVEEVYTQNIYKYTLSISGASTISGKTTATYTASFSFSGNVQNVLQLSETPTYSYSWDTSSSLQGYSSIVVTIADDTLSIKNDYRSTGFLTTDFTLQCSIYISNFSLLLGNASFSGKYKHTLR